uniref:DNA-directed DNA polymerase n=1 Tax=Steinernema glaseri TaxID=37863 RepID=A0A1I7ZPH1_9BILA
MVNIVELLFLGSLHFTLCRTCATSQNQKETCNHSVEERRLLGCWTHFELAKAVQLRYKVHKLHEVWTWENWSSDLFSSYINEFLKVKQEASGWPPHVMSTEAKERYLRDCREGMGIELEPSKVEHNPGLRFIAKLMLNSFWGKWGQRGDLVSTAFVSSIEEAWQKFADHTLEVISFTPLGENVAMLTYKKRDIYETAYKHGSLPVAIMTTSQARLHLYQYLESLGERVVYYDTDSVIFRATAQENTDLLSTHKGELLGQLKDESPDDPITHFVACGPKAYAYVTKSEKTCVKVRGITLDADAASTVHYASMKTQMERHLELYRLRADKTRLIDEDGHHPNPSLITERPQIVRENRTTLRTVTREKKFNVVNNKGFFMEPHGSRLFAFGFDPDSLTSTNP